MKRFLAFYKKRPWVTIFAYVAFLYSTLPFMRSFLGFLYELMGKRTVGLLVNFSLSFSGIGIISALMVKARSWKLKILFPFAGLAIALLIRGWILTPEEGIHFAEYGLLGWILFQTMKKEWSLPFISAALLASLFGGIDELIQWFLPNRVGDIRDVFMNAFAGFLGVSLAKIWEN